MGFADVFTPEDRVQVKFADFYNMMYEAARAEVIETAVRNGVPLKYIRGLIDMEVKENEQEDK